MVVKSTEIGRVYQERTLQQSNINYARWTEKEIAYLREHASTTTIVDMAIHLRRTFYATCSALTRHCRISSSLKASS
jgi:hypothetical protein